MEVVKPALGRKHLDSMLGTMSGRRWWTELAAILIVLVSSFWIFTEFSRSLDFGG